MKKILFSGLMAILMGCATFPVKKEEVAERPSWLIPKNQVYFYSGGIMDYHEDNELTKKDAVFLGFDLNNDGISERIFIYKLEDFEDGETDISRRFSFDIDVQNPDEGWFDLDYDDLYEVIEGPSLEDYFPSEDELKELLRQEVDRPRHQNQT